MMSVEFNPEVILSEEINKSMSKFASEYAIRVVIKCAKKYGFDADEAIAYLKLRETKTTITTDKKVVVELKKNATNEVETEKVGKPAFSFPYDGEINTQYCFGLNLNGGLYTQCESLPKVDGFCGRCNTQRAKNSHGKPNYGTIQDRASVDLLSFVDPSGRKVTPYSKYMTSKKLSRDDVFNEAGKYNITINLIHFENPQEHEENSDKKKKGGRPPVKKSVVQINEDEAPVLDLYEELIKHNEAKQRHTLPLPEVIQVVEKPVVVLEEEDQETEILKNLVIEEEAKPASEIKETNVEKKKPSNKKKATDTDKEQKEAEKKAEKERKEAEKKAEKERKEGEKKSKPQSKKTEKVVQPKKVVIVEPTPQDDDDVSSIASSEQDEESSSIDLKKDDCYSLIINRVQYWISTDTNLAYDDSHKQIGRYNKNTKDIIFNTDDEELEEEDDYINEDYTTNDSGCGDEDCYDDIDREDEEEYNRINK